MRYMRGTNALCPLNEDFKMYTLESCPTARTNSSFKVFRCFRRSQLRTGTCTVKRSKHNISVIFAFYSTCRVEVKWGSKHFYISFSQLRLQKIKQSKIAKWRLIGVVLLHYNRYTMAKMLFSQKHTQTVLIHLT